MNLSTLVSSGSFILGAGAIIFSAGRLYQRVNQIASDVTALRLSAEDIKHNHLPHIYAKLEEIESALARR